MHRDGAAQTTTTRAPPEWEATARVARLNPPAMFAVAPSRLFDAGEGLFARRPIRRGTLVRLDTRPSDPHRPMEFEWDHLDFFIPVLSDGASPCVVNGQLSDIRTARRVCSVVQAPAYVRAPDEYAAYKRYRTEYCHRQTSLQKDGLYAPSRWLYCDIQYEQSTLGEYSFDRHASS